MFCNTVVTHDNQARTHHGQEKKHFMQASIGRPHQVPVENCKSVSTFRGQCYDHSFHPFSRIFCETNDQFSKEPMI
jgi:hypothetical protein